MNIQFVVRFVAFMFLVAVCLWLYTIDTMTTEQRKRYYSWLYIVLPRFITKRCWFQDAHYKALFAYSNIMFRSRCFPSDHHRLTDIGIGMHCPDCHAFYPHSPNARYFSKKTLRRVMKVIV